MILVGFLLIFKCKSLIIDFSLGKDTWLDIYFLLRTGVQLHFHGIVPFLWIFTRVLFLVKVISVLQFILNLGVELRLLLDLLWPEDPLRHLRKSPFPLNGHEVVVKESANFFLLLFSTLPIVITGLNGLE